MKPNDRMTALPAVLAVAALLIALPVSAQTAKIATPQPLAPLVQKWADTYSATHAGAKFEIASVPASEAALGALKDRKAEIATVSRRIKRKEAEICAAALGARPNEYKVGVCAVAVYVHTNNTIKALDLDLIESILKGETLNWKEAGGKEGAISVYLPKDSPRVMDYIAEEFLVGKPLPATVRLIPQAELAAAVAGDANALGFADALAADGVRVLGIKRAQSSPPETPTVQTIAEMDYPVARYVYQVVAAEADKGETKAWLDWIRSDAGQKAIEGTGYYAIPMKQRVK